MARRWTPVIQDLPSGEYEAEMVESKTGRYVLHEDLVFEMAETRKLMEFLLTIAGIADNCEEGNTVKALEAIRIATREALR